MPQNQFYFDPAKNQYVVYLRINAEDVYDGIRSRSNPTLLQLRNNAREEVDRQIDIALRQVIDGYKTYVITKL
jgi:hypothetical protein